MAGYERAVYTRPERNVRCARNQSRDQEYENAKAHVMGLSGALCGGVG